MQPICVSKPIDNPPPGARQGYRDIVVPGAVLRNYRELGLSDAEFGWVIHLFTQSGESLLLSDIKCRANKDTQSRYSRHLRGLGLLFTYRCYRQGRCAGQTYDLTSLIQKCERLEAWRRDDHPREEFHIELPPDVAARLRAGEYDDVPARLAQAQDEEKQPRGSLLARLLDLRLPGNVV